MLQSDMTRRVFESRADPMQMTFDRKRADKKFEALKSAMQEGYINTVTSLVKNRALDINYKDDNNRTAAHYACMWDQLEVLKILCRENAFLETKDKEGNTPLLTAIVHGHNSCVACLLREGVKLEVRDKSGKSLSLSLSLSLFCSL